MIDIYRKKRLEAAHRIRESSELANHELDNTIIEITRRFSEMSVCFENRLLQAMNSQTENPIRPGQRDMPLKSIPEINSIDQNSYSVEKDHGHSIYRANYPIVQDPMYLRANSENENEFYKSLERKFTLSII